MILSVVFIKPKKKPAQDFSMALRREKAEPWAVDVLVHRKNVFSADTTNTATGV